jgi:APA family basic amino acid/polyamine antiporter
VTPAVYLVLTSVLTVAAFWERSRVSTYSLLSILAGIPVYYVWHFVTDRRTGNAEPAA